MSTLREWVVPGEGVSLVRDTFVETGTCMGDTLREAITQPFKRIVTMEVCEGYWERARSLFGVDPRVEVLLGSSPLLIPPHVRGAEATTFWLDAHALGDNPGAMDPAYGECPLIWELRAIREVEWVTPPIIVVDDSHYFDREMGWWGCKDSKPFKREMYPTVPEILAELGELGECKCLNRMGRLYLLPEEV